LRKISASQNNSENKSSVGSVSGLAKTEQPQILPNHCDWKPEKISIYIHNYPDYQQYLQSRVY
ncbi:hypothetical protein, partial [uncultured Duncaniella sp.]|uniref:hypothetical protein n=1 Tax=uncultured Duncaniella sp. TaxID=2768039 RepID=UPI0025B6A60C